MWYLSSAEVVIDFEKLKVENHFDARLHKIMNMRDYFELFAMKASVNSIIHVWISPTLDYL